MDRGREFVRWAAVAAAGMYGITGLAYAGSAGTPVHLWLATLWLILGCAVGAAGFGQERASGGGRVFALLALAILVGAGLAIEAMGLDIGGNAISGQSVPGLVHPLGFLVSWPAFLLALVEGVFALGSDNRGDGISSGWSGEGGGSEPTGF